MIAIVYPQLYGVGGIARYLESFLENLPTDAPPVQVITSDYNRRPLSLNGVTIVHVPAGRGRFDLATWSWRVRQRLIEMQRRDELTCVNLHWPPLIPGLFIPEGLPLVLTAHTTYHGMSGGTDVARYFQSQWGPASLAIKTRMEQAIFAKARKVITLTEQGRAEVLHYGYRGPIVTLPNGADTQTFHPDPTVVKDIDVLFCGRIEPRKGSRSIPALCRALVEARPGIRIVIVGYGEDDAWLRGELTPLSRNVEMTGKVPLSSMCAYYHRSRVYASTSYYEGLPGTCLEALSSGVPAVVWDLLFYRGLVSNGTTGLLAPVGAIEAMSAAVQRLLADDTLRARLGAAGRARLEAEYDWRGLAAKIVEQLSA